MSKKTGECALCKRKNQVLKLSHIIPKFTYEREKTYQNSRFRNFFNPYDVFQDGEKKHLLCGDCEQYFSKYECEFARKFLNKYLKVPNQFNDISDLIYDGINNYIVSVAWRILYDDLYIYNSYEGDSNRIVFEELEKRLRKYLNQNRKDIQIADEYPSDFDFDKLSFGEKIAFCEKENSTLETLEDISCNIFTLKQLGCTEPMINLIQDKIFGYCFWCANTKDYIVFAIANGLAITVKLCYQRTININLDSKDLCISSVSKNVEIELYEELNKYIFDRLEKSKPIVDKFLNENNNREKIINRYRNQKRKK